MPSILVYAQFDQDGVADLSLQCLAKARALAAAKGAQVEAVLIGSDAPALVETLKAQADTVLTAAGGVLADYLAVPQAKVLAQVVKERQPALVFLPANTVGNDLAPRVAALLDAPAFLDCLEVTCDGTQPFFKRLEFDAKAITAYTAPAPGPWIATLKDGIAPAAPGGKTAAVVSIGVTLAPADLKGKLEKREVARKTVNLKDAKIIIGGGAGVGNKANFQVLEKLAAALHGEIGATRAAVDAGWVSHERQIGQTGVTVRPDLYIACGISGAVQHSVGIREAKTIVAINTDPSAPIFKLANYRIVGDLTEVVPRLAGLLQG